MWCGTLCGAHEAETLTLAQVQGQLGLEPQQVLQEQELELAQEQELELALH